ncbi:hypothetical protein GTP38_24650 [Duganella sp. FT94W]|uniref:Glycosyltransferase n=1 Tax=Duganella lactea TaxID=2692173 RepID=A0ABW9VD06_9BURK|nr:glycosyltransferase family 1 protein [Duganella lactea]MYM37521.1 hypothetical protein [Duganella lactea]
MGHIVPLSQIAVAMQAQGHRVALAVNDLTHAPQLLAPHGIPCFQAPRFVPPAAPRTPLRNHADVLRFNGYDQADRLHSLINAWRDLLRLLRADKVICEFAPTAQLAAGSMAIPAVSLDNGFYMPPPQDPMPPLRVDEPAGPLLLRQSEKRVLETVNAVLARLGSAALPRFCALYQGEVWYRNWTEFNHYGAHSPQRHVGQIFGPSVGAAPVWPVGDGPRIFAYVKADNPAALDMLRSAISAGFRILAYLPGHRQSDIEALRRSGRAHISAQPVCLAQLDHEIEIGVWQSPTGGIGHSLEKGMRMLFLPTQVEQLRACLAVRRAGLPAYVAMGEESWMAVFDKLLGMPRVGLNRHWQPADVPRLAALLAG